MIALGPARLLEPVPSLGDPRVRLFLTSATLLFVELFLIRWIPSNVIYFGFFTNLILIASFLGIGLGIILGRRNAGPRLAPFPLLFFVVIKLISAAQLNVTVGRPTTCSSAGRSTGASKRTSGCSSACSRWSSRRWRRSPCRSAACSVDAPAARVRDRHHGLPGRDRRVHRDVVRGRRTDRLDDRGRRDHLCSRWVAA